MSINISNINSLLKSISTTNTTKTTSTTGTTSSTTYSDSIFEKASKLVAEYKEKQNQSTGSTSTTKSTYVGGLSFTQVANMSTSEFLNYAYENKGTSNYKESSSDSSGVKLPSLVLYRTKLVSTAGKSFMQVVAKLKAQLPGRSEEEIAAELMAKYGTEDTTTSTTSTPTTTTTQTTGSTLNLSA